MRLYVCVRAVKRWLMGMNRLPQLLLGLVVVVAAKEDLNNITSHVSFMNSHAIPKEFVHLHLIRIQIQIGLNLNYLFV